MSSIRAITRRGLDGTRVEILALVKRAKQDRGSGLAEEGRKYFDRERRCFLVFISDRATLPRSVSLSVSLSSTPFISLAGCGMEWKKMTRNVFGAIALDRSHRGSMVDDYLRVSTLTLPLRVLAEVQDIADGYYMVQWNNRATTVRSRSRVQKP